MQKALLLVMAAGAAIGLAWPSGPAPAGQEAAPRGEMRESVLERSEGGHFYANVEVNGQLVRFLVDTGAYTVALAEKDARRIGIPFDPSEYEQVGVGASGPVRGKPVTLARVDLDGKVAQGVSGAILEGSEISLLGQNFLGRFSIEMRGDTMRIY
jgi:aspartyl protease family protein